MRIRPYKLMDAPRVASWLTSEKEYHYWCAGTIEYPVTPEALERKREEFSKQEDGIMFTALNDAGEPVGFFSVMRVDYKMGNAHLGHIIIDPSLRGKGLGREMASLAVRYCFELLDVQSVTLKVFDSNESARMCYEAVGFISVRPTEKPYIVHGEAWSGTDMIITASRMKRIVKRY